MPSSPVLTPPIAAPKDHRNRRLEKQVVSTNFSVQDRRNNARLFLENKQRKEHLLPLGKADVAVRLQIYRQPVDTVLDEGVVERRSEWRETLLEQAATGKKTHSKRDNQRVTLTAPDGRPGSNNGTGKLPPAPSARKEKAPGGPDRLPPANTKAGASTPPQGSDPLAAPGTGSSAPPPPGSRLGTAPLAGRGAGHHRRPPVPDLPPPRTAALDEWIDKGCPAGSWRDLLAQELYLPEKVERVLYKAKYSRRGTFTTERLAAMVRGPAYGYFLTGVEDDDDEEDDDDDDEDEWMLTSTATSNESRQRSGEESGGDERSGSRGAAKKKNKPQGILSAGSSSFTSLGKGGSPASSPRQSARKHHTGRSDDTPEKKTAAGKSSSTSQQTGSWTRTGSPLPLPLPRSGGDALHSAHTSRGPSTTK